MSSCYDANLHAQERLSIALAGHWSPTSAVEQVLVLTGESRVGALENHSRYLYPEHLAEIVNDFE